MDVTFVAYEPDREIAWTIASGGKGVGHVYGYRLEPIEEGTDRHPVLRLVGHPGGGQGPRHFPVVPEVAPRATLGICTVVPGVPRPALDTV